MITLTSELTEWKQTTSTHLTGILVPKSSLFNRAFSLTWLALCKSIGTKGSIYVRKDFNSHRIGLVHQYGRHFIVFGTPIWPPWRNVKTLFSFLNSTCLWRISLKICCWLLIMSISDITDTLTGNTEFPAEK